MWKSSEIGQKTLAQGFSKDKCDIFKWSEEVLLSDHLHDRNSYYKVLTEFHRNGRWFLLYSLDSQMALGSNKTCIPTGRSDGIPTDFPIVSMITYYDGLTEIFVVASIWQELSPDCFFPPVICALLVEAFGIFNDIIVLSIFFPTGSNSTRKFSAVMAIFNLLIRYYCYDPLPNPYSLKNRLVPKIGWHF